MCRQGRIFLLCGILVMAAHYHLSAQTSQYELKSDVVISPKDIDQYRFDDIKLFSPIEQGSRWMDDPTGKLSYGAEAQIKQDNSPDRYQSKGRGSTIVMEDAIVDLEQLGNDLFKGEIAHEAFESGRETGLEEQDQ